VSRSQRESVLAHKSGPVMARVLSLAVNATNRGGARITAPPRSALQR
jgi:hypothetical protein